ncbi:polysaccharide biosynthesis tyrosine autokinase [candidate division KSB1 bacterium]|nr:polysaccharide biosynthesis tyrosine autokinase [candidate division KSB1 bacterium]
MDKKLNENDFFFDDDSKDDEINIDVRKYVLMLLKRKWIILIVFLLVAIPWAYKIQKQPPVYRASCTIRFRNLASGSQNDIDAGRIIEFKSRTFAEEVVAQLGLTLEIDGELEILRQDVFDEFFTTKTPNSGFYRLRWGQDSSLSINRVSGENEYKVFQGDISSANRLQETDSGFSFRFTKDFISLPNEINFKINHFRASVQYFQSRTRVNTRGGLLFLEMADKNPVFVAKKANSLAELYVAESKNLKKSTIESQKSTIKEQLMFAERELDEADQALKQFKSRHKVSLGAETNEVVGDLKQVENELEEMEKYNEDLNILLEKLESYLADPNEKDKAKYVYQQITELGTFSSNQRMGLLRKQLRDVQREYETTVTQFSSSHEKSLKLENQLNALYSKIKDEAITHGRELQNDISIESVRKRELEYKLARLPEEELQLTELQRQLNAKQVFRQDLLTQSQKVQLSDAVETEVIDILDPALVPHSPTNADKNMKMAIGAVFGLILGVAVAFVLEFLDKAIKTVDDVKRYLKLQVLGTIPHIDFKDLSDYQDSEKIKQIDQQLVTYDYSPTPIGEAYRSLRTNLVYSKNTGRVQSFVVTSSAPGDGKSFTSANIAISMAQHKSNTLLIDADLRRGVLHNTYGVSKEPGFTNYLTGMVGLRQIVNETLIPNLSMISCGSLLPNPSELLGSHQMQRFLDEARRKFDVIIFDSPPLNAATDAIVLGTQVDALVLVVRSGVTNRDMAKQKLELFRNVPVKILGVVLNGTSAEFGHDGYSYYHY